MNRYVSVLAKSRLFGGITDEEIAAMLGCLNAKLRAVKKGEYVYRCGDRVESLCVLADGKLIIQSEDYWGNSNILNSVEPGEMFGEAYIAPNSGAILNNVVAIEQSTVMLFDARRVMTSCPTACRFHSALIQNLFYAISEKNRKLVQKLGHMSKRSTRQKLISYLSEESKRQNSDSFTIAFNRQQLADFLYVDRSAMSNELCKMRDEGLIAFGKNKFTLIK